MKAKDLIEMLGNCPPDMEVMFAYPAKDYCHSTVCSDIDDIDVETIEWSEYHRSFKAQEPDRDWDQDEAEKSKQVILLR